MALPVGGAPFADGTQTSQKGRHAAVSHDLPPPTLGCPQIGVIVQRFPRSAKQYVGAVPFAGRSFTIPDSCPDPECQAVACLIRYDNLKAVVQRVLEGRNRQEQESFIVFRSHYY